MSRVVLLPLDEDLLRTRLRTDDFTTQRLIEGAPRSVHAGPEFPGDALGLYRRFLPASLRDGVVPGTYVVVDLSCGEVVAQVGTIAPPGVEPVEISYGVNATHRGRGVATEAVGLLLALLRDHHGAATIIARTSLANPASARVLEKNGFVVTGHEADDVLLWMAPASPP